MTGDAGPSVAGSGHSRCRVLRRELRASAIDRGVIEPLLGSEEWSEQIASGDGAHPGATGCWPMRDRATGRLLGRADGSTGSEAAQRQNKQSRARQKAEEIALVCGYSRSRHGCP